MTAIDRGHTAGSGLAGFALIRRTARLSRIAVLAGLSCLSAFAPGAASARPRPGNAVPPDAATATGTAQGGDDGLRLEGGLGSLDTEAVEGAMEGARTEVDGCYRAGVGRFRYLSGRLGLRARVRADGTVKSIAITAPIGDRETERCVLDVVRKLRLRAPRGGEAEFEYAWEFRTRAPVESWVASDLQPVFRKRRDELRPCEALGNVPPGLRVTLYVMPGGRVGALGLGADAPLDERYAACVATRVSSWTFTDPQGRVARATYQFGR